MIDVVRKMKLSRISTVLKYIGKSWRNSLLLKEKGDVRWRFLIAFDLFYCFLRYGADFNDYCTFCYWKIGGGERNAYITLRRNDKLRFALSDPTVYNLFLDKAAFNNRFSQYMQRAYMVSSSNCWKELVSFIEKNGTVIAKPLQEFGGHGVIKIDTSSSLYNERLELLKSRIYQGVDFVVEECIENVGLIKKLAPASLNTIRVVTVIDRNNEVHIVASLLRMGNGTAVTDNYHDGGMAVKLDLEHESLIGRAYGMDCKEYDKHPYSGFVFDGLEIPDLQGVKEYVRQIALEEPSARYVGWDIAVTAKGLELLEGNIPPGEDITQIATGKGIWYDMLNLVEHGVWNS